MKADSKYISYLDGLRGYAIAFVLLGHFYIVKLTFAQVGVTLFFFISGFLITKLLITEHVKLQKIILKDFYLRRFFRLYPALILMVVTYCIVVWGFGYSIVWQDIFSGLFYYTNYYLVYFKPALPDPKYLFVSPILWSLSVEEHFYLIFPLLFAFLFSKGRVLATVLTVLIALVLIARLVTDSYFVAYYTTHCRADSILYGCLSALLVYHHNSEWYFKVLRSKPAFYSGILLLMIAILVRIEYFQQTLAFTLEGISFFILVPSFLFMDQGSIIQRVVNNKFCVFVGKLSYSLYLFHWVALQIGIVLFIEKSPAWYAFVVPASIGLSLFSYYFVETPFVALRRKFGSHAQRI